MGLQKYRFSKTNPVFSDVKAKIDTKPDEKHEYEKGDFFRDFYGLREEYDLVIVGAGKAIYDRLADLKFPLILLKTNNMIILSIDH